MRALRHLALLVGALGSAQDAQVEIIVKERAQKREEHFVVGIQETAHPFNDVPKGLKEVVMTHANGQKMRCLLPDGTGPPNTEIVAQDDETDTANLNHDRGQVIKALKKALGRTCLSKVVGYWTYDVCPFDRVEQYHMERNVKSMQFDLGFYNKATAKESGDHSQLPNYKQEFTDGTQKRKTTVIFKCDKGTTQSQHALASVTEPSELSYVMTITTPLVCFHPKESGKLTPAELLMPFRNQCIFLNTGWWTYKHCHLHNLTQYHKENLAAQQAESQWVTVADFGLGEVVKSNTGFNGELHVADKPEDTYMSWTYKGGTPCDIGSKLERETEVRWYCDLAETNALAGIKEVSTCKYQMKVTTRSLCSHPAFKPVMPLVHEIDCRPLALGEPARQ